MLFVIPIVLGAIALTCTLTAVESPHLQGLTTIAASSIGVTAYATRALIDRLHRTNSRRTPLAHVLSRHFNHLAAATLPRISYVLNELAPYSGPLSLVAVNTLPSSPALTPYVNRVGAWLGPRKPTFDFELFFEWQPIHEDDGSIHCGSDDAYYLSLTGLCYRMPPRALLVRSLDVYRYDMKTLVVYGQMPRMPVCMPGDLAHLQRSGIRSAPISRQGNFVITSMNRVISVQQSMPVALSHSSSGAVLSLDIYRPEMKNLAVYGQATPLRRCIYTELLHTLFTALSTLAGIYRRGIAILTNFHPLRIALVFVCALALFRVYTQAMPIMICCGLTGTKTVVSLVLTPTQQLYILILINPCGNKPKGSNQWSFVPRFALEAPYGQGDRGHGPKDEVSQALTWNSHGVSTGSVTSTSGASDIGCNADVPTLENHPARLADNTQHNVDLDVWVDMSLETDAGNEGTPLDTPKPNEDGTGISASDEVGHASTTPNSSGLLSLSTVGSSETITNERADAFFADMATDPFVSSCEGLSTIIEEDSGQVTPTATGLLTEESLDLVTDVSLGSRLLDIDLASLGDLTNSLNSALDGPATEKVESRDMYGPPPGAPTPAPGPARPASALATLTPECPSEDGPDHLRSIGLETSGGEEYPTPGPGGLPRLLAPSKSYNTALSGLAPPSLIASPSLPLLSSPSPLASSLFVPNASYVAMPRDQDESLQKSGDSPMETIRKRTTKSESAAGYQEVHKAAVEGSSGLMRATFPAPKASERVFYFLCELYDSLLPDPDSL